MGALVDGILAGLGIAVPVGPIAVLLIDLAGPARVSVAVLLLIAALRLRTLARTREDAPRPTERASEGLRLCAAFLGLTLLNPVTVAYFAALIVGLQTTALVRPSE